MLEPAFRSGSTVDWLERLSAQGVPCAPVNDVATALADAQTVARDAVVEISHPVLGAIREVASPLRFDDFPAPVKRGPFRGEDTAEILGELCGYTKAQIDDALNAAAAVGDDRIQSATQATINREVWTHGSSRQRRPTFVGTA